MELQKCEMNAQMEYINIQYNIINLDSLDGYLLDIFCLYSPVYHLKFHSRIVQWVSPELPLHLIGNGEHRIGIFEVLQYLVNILLL